MEERLDRIETKLAYLEDFLNRIQETVLEHTAALEQLKRESGAVKSKVSELIDTVTDIPNIRPPHY